MAYLVYKFLDVVMEESTLNRVTFFKNNNTPASYATHIALTIAKNTLHFPSGERDVNKPKSSAVVGVWVQFRKLHLLFGSEECVLVLVVSYDFELALDFRDFFCFVKMLRSNVYDPDRPGIIWQACNKTMEFQVSDLYSKKGALRAAGVFAASCARLRVVNVGRRSYITNFCQHPPRSSNSSLNSLKPINVRSTPNIPAKVNNQPKVAKPTPPWNHHNNNNNDIKIHGKLKRPVPAFASSNVTKRGQTQASSKSEQPPRGADELTRCSSVTNLTNSDAKSKGAFSKLHKAGSKDKLIEKKEASNNNKFLNKIDDDDSLQNQLKAMAKEKSDLMLELGERKGELEILKNEIVKLKEQSLVRIEQLSDENVSLRNRLRDIAHSPLSDNEKQQLLFDTERHSSAPASIATNMLDDDCTTPDWDKHSSSNVSEVSVACLQDKINQMQETHYSTNEELQATLQELTDLQRQLTELQQDNERLLDEKNLMFDSLCRQTERLNDARSEVESLKQMLYRDKDDGAAEREEVLTALLKASQADHKASLLKHEHLTKDLQEANEANARNVADLEQLTERVRTLESALDAKHAEHKQLDHELVIAKDQCSGRQIEINRLTDLLENARTKINELEQERALNDKSELDELLDNARKEKDALESEVANLKEQIARSRNEGEKLREQVSILQEECKVTRNNAKCTQSELEYKCEMLMAEKSSIAEKVQQLQEATNELQVQAQYQLEDKRQLSTVLSETQRNLSEAERRNSELDLEIEDLKRLRKDENEEWEKFQNDLLTSVRVANDFKSEAQQELQKMIMENKTHRDRIRQLETQIDKLKANDTTLRQENFSGEELAVRRQKVVLNRQNSRQSVKSLIESIENAAKPSIKLGLNIASRSSSNSSLNSLTSDAKTPTSPTPISPDCCEPTKAPPCEQQQPNKQQTRDWTKPMNDKKPNAKDEKIDYNRRNSYSDLCDRKDPLNGLVKNGGSKRNALLKWCQNKTVGYRNIDITNFSSSWNDGLAFCAILHTYLPDLIPYDGLIPQEKRRNFSLAFAAAESVGISTTLYINDMVQQERPDWQQVMAYITAIYKHFET
ncbi:hypothetical protein FQR65_LT13634 [Abscondita terminalis]|nr:hypothetical protein FQR65_LT13634 [Abscondita terminalis]